MDTGIDYAGSSPGAAAVKAANFQFVARYLSRFSSKTIKKPEYDDMTNNGVGVVLVFEDAATQALQGYDQGVKDAQVALQQANALGWPSNRPLYFAVDFDINDAQKPVAGQYMQGVISVLGLARTGAYGGFYWIKYCFDNGLATFGWQAVAWSGNNIDGRAHIFQQLSGTVVNGTSCDIDRALKPDYGQNKGVSTSMTITDADFRRIWSAQGFDIGPAARQPTVEEVNNAVGRDFDEFMDYWLNTEPVKKAKADAALFDSVTADLQGQIDALKKQLAEVTNTPVPTPSPTPAPTPGPQISIWQQIINFFTGKK